MTVLELIEALQEVPSDAVVLAEHESGWLVPLQWPTTGWAIVDERERTASSVPGDWPGARPAVFV